MGKSVSKLLILLLIVYAAGIKAQESTPILVDEFGKLTNEDTFVRLDNLLAELKKTPDARGAIRIYGGNDDCFLCRYSLGSWMKSLATNTRQFPSENISVEYCDEKRNDLRTELYIVPANSIIEKCSETIEPPKNSVRFDSVGFYFKNNKLSPIEDTIIDVVSPSNGEYSRTVWKKVIELLAKFPESKIYVMVYLGTNLEYRVSKKRGLTTEKVIRKLDKHLVAKTLLQNGKNELIKYGIPSVKITTIEGGFVDYRRRLEFWFVPKDGNIPKPEPNYLPGKK